ncbi:MAG: oligopeptide transporter, OPT family [Acidobacteriota bacterium]
MTTVSGQEYPDIIGAAPDNPAASTFEPYIASGTELREFTALPIVIGTVLGMIFGASSLYLVLKVGLTVSASIPVAVISITLFRILSKFGLKNATILENNIVQTAGSAGESIAFGVGVTMPAIMILGFDLEITRVVLVSVLGGLLGILMMIPLRRALIVQQHGLLKYPEGTACAEVLKAGASEESKEAASDSAKAEARSGIGSSAPTGAKTIFTGFGIGIVYKSLMEAFATWKNTPEKIFGPPFNAASISAEISPELLGVGYIIGPRIASIMAAGGVLAYLVLIPMIKFFGAGLASPLAPETQLLIRDMSPGDVRNAYVLYIGAGAVAAGGIISLFRSLPIIWHGLKGGLKDLSASRSEAHRASVARTDRDLPMNFVLIGIVGLLVAISVANPLYVGGTGIAARIASALLIVVFGFLFVTVSSRLTGEIGSSSNPISGMTVATLLLTCLIFVILGWTGSNYFVTALSVGAIVCIASSNGGTTSQDLKTGYLVGSTPSYQQIAILIGAFASALVLGPILLRLNEASTVYVPRVTFEHALTETQVPLPTLSPQETAALPIYVGTVKPAGAGNFRLLAVGTAGIPQAKDLSSGNYLVDQSGNIAWKMTDNFPAALHVDPSTLTTKEKIPGPQGVTDTRTFSVWQRTDESGGFPGRYLVDEGGTPVYLVDPGINGSHTSRPDGTIVNKFSAPKATLMSYIIKGILGGALPWGLVLLGVMIAIVLEMSGIPSLAFAVGVYLPLSSSSPIFIGGMVRFMVDRYLRRKFRGHNLTEEQLVAEGDKSPGVLMASGYIAGGAIAGIIIAFMAGVLTEFTRKLTDWSTIHNPFYGGEYSDLLSLVPFACLIAVLYLTGREVLMSGRKSEDSNV